MYYRREIVDLHISYKQMSTDRLCNHLQPATNRRLTRLKVGTNADSGYTVKIEQNDQMGKDGITCTGNPTDPVATNCIPDNPGNPSNGGSSLNFDTADDCDLASTNGLCFSMDDGEASGSPTFEVEWDQVSDDCDSTPTFCAKAAADAEERFGRQDHRWRNQKGVE